MSTILRVVILCGLGVAASAQPAAACTCAMRPVCAAFWEADLVFTGRAEVAPLGPGAQRTRFRVEESFRGPAGGGVVDIVARGIGGSCAYAFVHGVRYFVFARRAHDGAWGAFFCDPTAPLDQAGEALAFARGAARDSHRGGLLAGSLLIDERARDGQVGLLSPRSGVRIDVLREGERGFSTVTDSQGQYRFTDVAPGHYTLTVATPSDVDPIAPAAIHVKGPGACAFHTVTGLKRWPG